jgi:hypothetical protein
MTHNSSILVGLLAFAFVGAHSQERQTLVVDAEGFPKEAAIQNARQEALRRSGIRLLTTFTELSLGQGEERHVARQVYVGALSAGLIDAEEVLSCKLVIRGIEPDEVPVYLVKLRVRVAMVEPPDPYFSVALTTTPSTRVFRNGERLDVHVTSTQDCYLILFTIGADNKLWQVFPSKQQRTNHLTAHRIFDVSDLVVRSLTSDGPVSEQLIAVATKQQFPFIDLNDSSSWKVENDGNVEFSELGAATRLTEWLARLGEAQWAISSMPYSIVPQ